MRDSLWRSLLFLLRKPPAEQQWEAAFTLDTLGVPCVRPLACGIRRGFRGVLESVLVTEAFPGVPLTEWTKPDWPAVLRFLSQMHDSGALQPDLHAGNLLVSPETGELRLIDVGHVRFKGRLSESERLDNLAFLRLSIPVPVSPETERLSRELRQFVCMHRSKRCLKHNREFAPVRVGSLRWQVRTPFFEGPLRYVVEDPEQFVEAGTDGCYCGVRITRFKPGKRADLITGLVRGSRARRSFRRAYHLELVGITAPRPLAFADRKKAGLPACGYLVTEEVPEARTLASILEEKGTVDRRSVVRNLARVIARLHDEGFSAADLNATSFVIGPDSTPFLIDGDRLDFRDRISESAAARDLGCLARNIGGHPAVGRPERIIFLRAYCRARGLRRIRP